MKRLLKSMIWAILVGAGACGPKHQQAIDSSDMDPEGGDTVMSDAPPVEESLGGMDGGGGSDLYGLSFREQVFVQSLWQDGRPMYLVVNERSEDVELLLSQPIWPDGEPRIEEPLTLPWHVPSGAFELFAIDELEVLPGPGHPYIHFRTADGTSLGILSRTSPPEWSSELAIVSTEGINGSGSNDQQVETDFIAAPGATFSIVLSLTAGGDLSFPWNDEPSSLYERLEVLAVRSEHGNVQSTEDGFVVHLPDVASYAGDYTDAESTNVPKPPFRVEFDVAVPTSAAGRSFVLFEAWRCSQYDATGSCGSGGGVTRLFPLSN